MKSVIGKLENTVENKRHNKGVPKEIQMQGYRNVYTSNSVSCNVMMYKIGISEAIERFERF